VKEIIDLEDDSWFVIPARCLIVGQPFDRLRAGSFQAVVMTGWKAGPTIGIPEAGTLRAAATREGDKHRMHCATNYTAHFILRILEPVTHQR
jgi:hypothetical protein